MKSICQLITLPKVSDPRGNLSFVEGGRDFPFDVARAYWIYDVPGGAARGGHAFREQQEFIVALSGSFDVVLHDGIGEHRIQLNRSYSGLYIPSGIWRSMDNFSTNAVALVLASTHYAEEDYIRDFKTFIDFSKQRVEVSSHSHLIECEVEAYHARHTSASHCEVITLAINHQDKGNITVAEGCGNIPFPIRRVYYLYDIPGGEERGGHAHKELQQWIVAVSGSFDVVLDDGVERRTVTLNRPYQALRVVPGIWRELNNFSSGSICLVLASHHYDEQDYIRDYKMFLQWKKKE